MRKATTTEAPDPRIQRPAVPIPERVEAAPVSSIRVPDSLKMRGGIPHPPIPQPAARPDDIAPRRWERATVAEPCWLHDACARGMA